ncbi:MAG: 2-hydroxyacyl-CoA dehydratase [Deltaproteobacteria bacterium]|nr:2-hydroxyacyl-CoA dehydratase [Deltaproteobacteria bacterium]
MSGLRSKKFLQASKLLTEHQKRHYEDVRDRAAQGEAVIWTNVGVPMEILYAMDIPVLFNLHWSALIAAKQMSAHYLNVMNERGYFRDLCRYCSMPLGYFMEGKPEVAPWGGVPRPTAVIVEAADDPIIRCYELMARELEVPFYVWDHTMPAEPPAPTWCETPDDVEAESVREPWRVDYAVQETEGLIAFLETVTGKSFSEAQLRRAMEMSNEQFDYIGKLLDLCARVPAPISSGDHMANLISTQFYRGSEFGLAHAKAMYLETKERVEKGLVACENEKIRLMQMVVPTWYSPGFYNAFEEKYGAVFVWIVYFTITQQLIRRDLRDPLRALASRYVGYTEMGLLPPWWPQWVVHNAKKHKIDAAVYQIADSCRLLSGPMQLAVKALQDIGVPTLELRADYVDDRDWDEEKMIERVSGFIETLL